MLCIRERKSCQQIHRQGADYVLLAKDNHVDLTQDIALLFEDQQADEGVWKCASFSDKGHGRREKRVVTTSGELKEYFAPDWKGIEQVFRLQRTRVKKGQIAFGDRLWD